MGIRFAARQRNLLAKGSWRSSSLHKREKIIWKMKSAEVYGVFGRNCIERSWCILGLICCKDTHEINKLRRKSWTRTSITKWPKCKRICFSSQLYADWDIENRCQLNKWIIRNINLFKYWWCDLWSWQSYG